MKTETLLVLINNGIGIAGALVFAVVLGFFGRQDGRTYLRLWMWSWLAFIIHTMTAVAGRLLSLSQPPTTATRIALSVVSLGAGYLQLAWMFLGTQDFVARRQLRPSRFAASAAVAAVIGLALTLLWIDDPNAASARYFMRVGLRLGVSCATFAAAGVFIASHRDSRIGIGGRLLPVAMLLYGCNQALQFSWALPISHPLTFVETVYRNAFASLEVFLQLLIGLGMLLWMLAVERQQRLADWDRMAEREERYRLLAESTSDGIVTIDTDGRILFANTAAAKTFGFEVAELRGRLATDLLPEALRAEYVARWREEIVGSDPLACDDLRLIGLHRSGRTIQLEMSFTEIVQNGRRQFTAIARDVSKRLRMEEQVRQSQKMEAVGRLAGGIAHDFNNLLTAINGYVDLSLEGLESGHAVYSRIEEIQRASRRAAGLTRQLLAFSRRQPIEAQTLDLNDAVAESGAMLARLLPEHVVVTFQLSRDEMFVDADPSMISQVLVNLSVNSRDAMPGGGRLVVETAPIEIGRAPAPRHPQARPGSFVCLRVSDTGCGIAAEHVPHIFDPFFTTKDVGEGTGLGLSTTYGIVRQHGGWIEVDTAVGEGTTFRVFLPRVARPAPAASVAEAASPHGGAETLLLVEDEPQLREIMHEALTSYGYHVVKAANGPQAVAAWRTAESKIDLLVSDVVMPDGMSGLDLAAQLRQEKPALKVILMSGYHDKTGSDLLDDSVMLSKPFGVRDLAAVVRRALDTVA